MALTRLTIDFKDSCRVATTGPITLSGGAPNTLDGITLALNDSILVKDQSNTAENGIYRITTLGTGSNGTWTRRSDFNDNRQITPGSLLFTEVGTVNGNTFYYIRGGLDTSTFTVGTTGLSFANLSATFGSGGTGYGNTQVGQYLTTYSGNITAGNITTISGQHIGYHTGAIGANTANTGAFTTVTTTSNVGVGGATAGQSGYRFALQGYAASAVPLYLHSDATNAYLYSPNPVYMGSTGANPTVLVSNNTARLTVDSAGYVGIGTTSPGHTTHISGTALRIDGTTGECGPYLFRGGNTAPDIRFYTSGSTIASPTAVSSGINLGQIHYQGHDGTTWQDRAGIWSVVDGPVSSGAVPSALRFFTGNTSLNEVVRITSGGNVGIGNTSPLNTLSVTGNIYASGNIFIPNASIQTNTIYSSNGNVAYKLDTTTYKRHLFTVNGFDFKNDNGILTPVNKTNYTTVYSGANASVVVPAGVTAIFVKMWGAGGGGGSYGGWRQGSFGGAGGFSHGIIQVVPAETIILRVGGRGVARPGTALSWPDGGGACTSSGGDNQYAASAGGSSSIYVPSQAAYVMYAGGGGGGGSVNGWSRNDGGAGGGLIGEMGTKNSYNTDGVDSGKGGTQSAGGAGATSTYSSGQAGSLGQGGSHSFSSCYGGGGGGGYYGGGAGGYTNGASSMGGGGGGSGRIHSSVLMGQTYTGTYHTPPFYYDPDLAYTSTDRYARGAEESNYGGHGLIVLYY